MCSVLLPYPAGCRQGIFLRRVKRFSVEFLLDGKKVWAHTNNSGSMLGLLRQGLPIMVSPAGMPGRKLPYTLELVGLPHGDRTMWVGVNTLTPNRLLRAAFFAGRLAWAQGYTQFKPEARCGESRLDALLTGAGLPPLWVECKNVTLVEDGVAAFPDAVTERGHKHLREMTAIAGTGARAAFFYCVQRADGDCFGPADYVDPQYAHLFFAALDAGVESYASLALAGPTGIDLGPVLPLAPRPCYILRQPVKERRSQEETPPKE